MLDRDLAVLYNVATGQQNRQVKRNIGRFPDDFMFQLTKDEWESLKCQIGISNERGGDRRALPYVFTEHAAKRVILVDNFVGERTLVILDKRAIGVSAEVFTRYTEQVNLDFEKHNKQCAEIQYVLLPHQVHDRYLIVDNAVWLLGSSVKDMGHGLCTIIQTGFDAEMILTMVRK